MPSRDKYVLIAMVVLALLACGFAVWKLHSSANAPTPSAYITYNLIDEKTALTQLQNDTQNVTPHFIPDDIGDSNTALTPEEWRIRNDLVALYAARYAAGVPRDHAQSALVEAQNSIWLAAIGTRYILVTEAPKFAIDEILDTQTGQVLPFTNTHGETKRYYFAPERSIALYIDPQSLYTYSLDKATTTRVTGSELSGSETYHNGSIDGATTLLINPEETHTDKSITISVFDSSKSVPNPDIPGTTQYAKVGQKTLSF